MNFSAKLGTPKKWWDSRAFRAFALGLGCSFLFFLPYIIFDQGYFLFYGDFNVQQIPFYQMIHDAIRSGNIGWSWTTDLGANLIGSYTFYNLGSPFFWVTLLFPSRAVPYLMGPQLMLKFAFSALAGYVYLRRYVKNQDNAVLGGLLYAFSGFAVYNIFFNHFHEAIIIFPLLIAALDEYMETGRRGLFALAVFASCLMNYYFFAGQGIFCFIYWIIRVSTGSWKNVTLRRFGWLAFESVIGVAMTAVLLAPTVLAVLQNNRVNSPTYGWGALLYGNEQRYLHILSCMFFPPDIPARANFTPDSNANWASLGAWLPFFSMTGVFAWMQIRKKHWSKKLVGTLLVMAFIPILNNAFQLFNSAFYARWYYMLTLMFALATVQAVETEEADWNRAFRWTFGITAAISLGIGLMPSSIDKTTGSISFGLEKYPERFWTYVAIAFLSLLLFYILKPLIRRNPKKFTRSATAGVLLMTVVYAAYFIGLGKTQSYDTHNFIIPYALNNGREVSLPDKEGETENYRVDFYQSMDNMAMYWQMPSIQAFHSIVPGSVMTFYPSIGVDRGVGSRPETSHYGIRGLLSVKYLFDYAGDSNNFKDGDVTQMPGFTYYATQNGFDVYVNTNYIPYGFTYDTVITRAQFEETSQGNRELLLLKAMMVEDEDFDRVAQVLNTMSENELSSQVYSQQAYAEDCAARNRETCYSFSRSGSGFTAQIDLSKDNYVFFSVPYESGWSAQVDGADVKIVKANNGFMSVLVPQGNHTITFTYRTPGLSAGLAVTLLSVLIFLLYLWLMPKRDERLSLHRAQEAAANEKIAAENRAEQLEASPCAAEDSSCSLAENSEDPADRVSPDSEISP